MTDTIDLVKHSIAKDDYPTDPRQGGGIWNIWIGPTGPLTQAPGLPPQSITPTWMRPRDIVLSSTREMEDMWSSAIYKAKTKTAALSYDIKDQDDSERRASRYQKMLLHFDGTRYVPGFMKVLEDFLLTDNGCFVEVVRTSNARGSRIIGLMHRDSFRVMRTGDVDIPYIYVDLKGREHEVYSYQMIDFVDEPLPRATAYGIGRCAASRAFRTILKLAAVEIYFREKVTGDRNLAIHIVNGVTSDQIDGALTDADADRRRRGYVYYKGSVVIPAVKMDAELSVITIPLASIPDGFDVETERKDAYLRYANAIGVPVQDIQPLSGQGLGTGTQTIILAEEAEGIGLAAFRKDWTHALNEYVLPETTTFTFTNPNDLRDQKQKAEVDDLRAATIQKLIGSPNAPGVLSQQQGLNLAVDWSIVPREYMPQNEDVTAEGDISDTEKPLIELPPMIAPPKLPAPVVPQLPATKAVEDDEWQEAAKWAEEISD